MESQPQDSGQDSGVDHFRAGALSPGDPTWDVSVAAGGVTPPAATSRAGGGALLALYVVSVFLSAFLLFLVQPMFGKLVLPLLGGSPAVWNTCMLFFQGALLAGYLYAHLSTRLLSVRRQAVVHVALLVVVALLLPISVRGAAPQGGEAPVLWLLALMAATVGPPFFVLAGTGPILQRWFAESGHPSSDDPYQLYAASNLGSMVALLAYPALVEPRLRLAQQGSGWTAGYLLLGLVIVGCAALGGRRSTRGDLVPDAVAEPAPIARGRRARWIFLAFVPSSLLLGVTTYVTTDLAPVPLLWVLPLALYLLSFTLVFARTQLIRHEWMVWSQVSLLTIVALLLLGDSLKSPGVALPIHLAALFVTAMVCHGELARDRPPASRLTEFYLWISVGGVLGGVFNVLLAPLLFTTTLEYPLVLVLACLARPWPRSAWQVHLRTSFLMVGLTAALILVTGRPMLQMPPLVFYLTAGATISFLAGTLQRAPLWLAVCLGGLLLVRVVNADGAGTTLHASRSFFGHYEVYRASAAESFHVLTHGSTIHGAQSLDPRRRQEPLTYYMPSGPLGDIFNARGISTRAHRVAIVGLGTGATAVYGEPGEEWTFYEIDPGIERIARDTSLFTYLADSPARSRVVLGDARISLARAAGERYDLIVLDAFSSDAVPIHLLTREALATYVERLANGGLLAFHISNRYLDLEPVLANLAADMGMEARMATGPATPRGSYEYSSTWVALARTAADLAPLQATGGWRPPQQRPGLGVWTDDFSSILSIFSW